MWLQRSSSRGSHSPTSAGHLVNEKTDDRFAIISFHQFLTIFSTAARFNLMLFCFDLDHVEISKNWATLILHLNLVRRIRCQADLNSFPPGELEKTTRTPPYYVDEDYPVGPEIKLISEPLPERSNWRGSESYTLENDVWCYALIVVHARNEWMNEWMNDISLY